MLRAIVVLGALHPMVAAVVIACIVSGVTATLVRRGHRVSRWRSEPASPSSVLNPYRCAQTTIPRVGIRARRLRFVRMSLARESALQADVGCLRGSASLVLIGVMVGWLGWGAASESLMSAALGIAFEVVAVFAGVWLIALTGRREWESADRQQGA